MTPQEQLKERLKASRAGLSKMSLPEGMTLEEYTSKTAEIISGKVDRAKDPTANRIINQWNEGNIAQKKQNERVDRSIARHHNKEIGIADKRFERLQKNTPLKARQVIGKTPNELLRHYDISELVDFYDKSGDLSNLAKTHGNLVQVGSEEMIGRASNKIIASSKLIKGIGAFTGGLMTANLVNDMLFDEPLPTPVVLLEAAGIGYVGYRAAMPGIEKQADAFTRKAYTAQKTEQLMKAKAQTPDAFQALMAKSDEVSGARLANRQVKNIHRVGSTIKGAGLFIAGASILHQVSKQIDKQGGKDQIRKQEKRQKEKLKEEEKKREKYRTGVSFGKVDTSTIVMDLFNERIGHHKMGNSRF